MSDRMKKSDWLVRWNKKRWQNLEQNVVCNHSCTGTEKPLWHPKSVLRRQELHKNKIESSLYSHRFEYDTNDDNVLQLNKNLYSSCDAPLAWFEALKHSLESRGFKASIIDPCLFIHKDMIIMCFVDNLIYIGHNIQKIDAMIANLGTEFLLTVEEDITSFLGIQI